MITRKSTLKCTKVPKLQYEDSKEFNSTNYSSNKKNNHSGFKNKGKCDFQYTSKYSNLVDMGSSSCYFQFEVSYLKFKNVLSHKYFFI